MPENDPKQVIVDYISEPLGQIEPEPHFRQALSAKGLNLYRARVEGLERRPRQYFSPAAYSS